MYLRESVFLNYNTQMLKFCLNFSFFKNFFVIRPHKPRGNGNHRIGDELYADDAEDDEHLDSVVLYGNHVRRWGLVAQMGDTEVENTQRHAAHDSNNAVEHRGGKAVAPLSADPFHIVQGIPQKAGYHVGGWDHAKCPNELSGKHKGKIFRID